MTIIVRDMPAPVARLSVSESWMHMSVLQRIGYEGQLALWSQNLMFTDVSRSRS